jgi:hypothetical protein
MTIPLGERELVGDECDRAVEVDTFEARGRGSAASHEVEADVAEIGAARGVDHQIVEVSAALPGQVGVLAHLAVGVTP